MQRRFIDDVRVSGAPGSTVTHAAIGIVNLHQHGHVPAGNGQARKALRLVQLAQGQAGGGAHAVYHLIEAYLLQRDIPIRLAVDDGFRQGSRRQAQSQRQRQQYAQRLLHVFLFLLAWLFSKKCRKLRIRISLASAHRNHYNNSAQASQCFFQVDTFVTAALREAACTVCMKIQFHFIRSLAVY